MNNQFALKIASDELLDTIFFSGLGRAIKHKRPGVVDLINDRLKVTVASFKNISVNGKRYSSVYAAKQAIMVL